MDKRNETKAAEHTDQVKDDDQKSGQDQDDADKQPLIIDLASI